MPSGTVLIVDDDAVLRRSLARALRLAGFTTDVAEGGRDALARIAAGRPDVVVLDVSMPDLSGTEVCRRLRADGNEVPVVMLSALDEADDRISGLQAGADDYLVKPFVTAELELRLKALLRRRPPATGVLRVGDLVVDADTRTARRNGTELDLTRREFDLLEVLARNQGVVLSRDRLLELVWGYDFDVGTNAVDTFVSYLRRKTEAGGASRLIHTVRGIGFLMRPR
ncbi:response regulator transcription factor [Virgisporangium aurantiacum]|uniref:Putative transcriptional regulatory protein PrrA n=1 Tax=Virgisporangium aurantiacum TaxID=175570 RepID=A0A8J3Z5H6_9ACTN|nr:response regulator transcription factor [Virgisporangium aurantiacum]GIJ55373.1 putative transcriptional regulatory protein PrrA [Virgisporangium aurantiacum]